MPLKRGYVRDKILTTSLIQKYLKHISKPLERWTQYRVVQVSPPGRVRNFLRNMADAPPNLLWPLMNIELSITALAIVRCWIVSHELGCIRGSRTWNLHHTIDWEFESQGNGYDFIVTVVWRVLFSLSHNFNACHYDTWDIYIQIKTVMRDEEIIWITVCQRVISTSNGASEFDHITKFAFDAFIL